MLNLLSAAQLLTADSRACPKALGSGSHHTSSTPTCGAACPPPSFLCSSQESSRRASARREKPLQSKDLDWQDPCAEHRDEGKARKTTFQQSPL
ncbi:hypothetical protein EIQ31_15675 [Agrobacterium deltaense]|nr:hypothetical protein EIQ31_15675 [Agrobacterium deltaense]